MLGSKVEANRLCAMYLRRCEEQKESRRVSCQKLKLCWHLSKNFCLYPVAVVNSICRSIIWGMYISTSVLPEIQLIAKLHSFFKNIFLTDIFCLAVARGTCTDNAYMWFKYIIDTESLASCPPRPQVLKSLMIQFFGSLSRFSCRLPGLALLPLLPCVQALSLSDLTLNLFGAQNWQEAMHFAWDSFSMI